MTNQAILKPLTQHGAGTLLWLLLLTTFLGHPQVQKYFPLLSSPYFCLPSPLFMCDTSSRTTSHTEFEYNV